MKRIVQMILLGLGTLLPVCAAESSISPEHQVILKGDWTPTKEQTEKALAAAITLVRQTAAQPAGTSPGEKYQRECAGKIAEGMAKYAVQFIGQTRNGKKFIHCSFFPGDYLQDVPYWKDQEVMVDDGGYSFWQVDYDPETGKCGKLRINGMG